MDSSSALPGAEPGSQTPADLLQRLGEQVARLSQAVAVIDTRVEAVEGGQLQTTDVISTLRSETSTIGQRQEQLMTAVSLLHQEMRSLLRDVETRQHDAKAVGVAQHEETRTLLNETETRQHHAKAVLEDIRGLLRDVETRQHDTTAALSLLQQEEHSLFKDAEVRQQDLLRAVMLLADEMRSLLNDGEIRQHDARASLEEIRSALRHVEIRQHDAAGMISLLQEEAKSLLGDVETRQHVARSVLEDIRALLHDAETRQHDARNAIATLMSESGHHFRDVETRQHGTDRVVTALYQEMRDHFRDIEVRQREALVAIAGLPDYESLMRAVLVAEINQLDGYAMYHRDRLREQLTEAIASLGLALSQADQTRQAEAAGLLQRLAEFGEETRAASTLERQQFEAARAQLADLKTSVADSRNAILRRLAIPSLPGGYTMILDDFTFVIPSEQLGLVGFLMQHAHAEIEPGVQRAIRENLRPGGTAIDVGANFGLHTCVMAQIAGATGRVVAFEPLPRMAGALKDSLALNGYNAEVVQKAVSDCTATRQLFETSHSPLSSFFPVLDQDRTTAFEVPTTTLDDHFAPGASLDFIKIDVEGAEPLVYAGMQRIIHDNPSLCICMEWSSSQFARSGFDPDAFFAQLTADGFEARSTDMERAAYGSCVSRASAATLEATNLLFVRNRTVASSTRRRSVERKRAGQKMPNA